MSNKENLNKAKAIQKSQFLPKCSLKVSSPFKIFGDRYVPCRAGLDWNIKSGAFNDIWTTPKKRRHFELELNSPKSVGHLNYSSKNLENVDTKRSIKRFKTSLFSDYNSNTNFGANANFHTHNTKTINLIATTTCNESYIGVSSKNNCQITSISLSELTSVVTTQCATDLGVVPLEMFEDCVTLDTVKGNNLKNVDESNNKRPDIFTTPISSNSTLRDYVCTAPHDTLLKEYNSNKLNTKHSGFNKILARNVDQGAQVSQQIFESGLLVSNASCNGNFELSEPPLHNLTSTPNTKMFTECKLTSSSTHSHLFHSRTSNIYSNSDIDHSNISSNLNEELITPALSSASRRLCFDNCHNLNNKNRNTVIDPLPSTSFGTGQIFKLENFEKSPKLTFGETNSKIDGLNATANFEFSPIKAENTPLFPYPKFGHVKGNVNDFLNSTNNELAFFPKSTFCNNNKSNCTNYDCEYNFSKDKLYNSINNNGNSNIHFDNYSHCYSTLPKPKLYYPSLTSTDSLLSSTTEPITSQDNVAFFSNNSLTSGVVRASIYDKDRFCNTASPKRQLKHYGVTDASKTTCKNMLWPGELKRMAPIPNLSTFMGTSAEYSIPNPLKFSPNAMSSKTEISLKVTKVNSNRATGKISLRLAPDMFMFTDFVEHISNMDNNNTNPILISPSTVNSSATKAATSTIVMRNPHPAIAPENFQNLYGRALINELLGASFSLLKNPSPIAFNGGNLQMNCLSNNYVSGNFISPALPQSSLIEAEAEVLTHKSNFSSNPIMQRLDKERLMQFNTSLANLYSSPIKRCLQYNDSTCTLSPNNHNHTLFSASTHGYKTFQNYDATNSTINSCSLLFNISATKLRLLKFTLAKENPIKTSPFSLSNLTVPTEKLVHSPIKSTGNNCVYRARVLSNEYKVAR